MSAFNPDHLLQQAERLIASSSAGPPRQVDLRRAISAAYYAVFHALLTAAANEFVGASRKGTARYTLVYRSVDHRALRDLCNEAKRPHASLKYRKFAPAEGFGPDIQAFATAVLELQEKRHVADYDPSQRMKSSDARLAIGAARSAIRRFGRASGPEREALLTLLLFPPR